MPERGEGGGIVYVEALACDVPVVASSLLTSHEAVRVEALSEVIDPDDAASVQRGILQALATERDGAPRGWLTFRLSTSGTAGARPWTACSFLPAARPVSPK